jgi:ssDNA-binding Zn-finger/Zn-ribbon topoisomerase 1
MAEQFEEVKVDKEFKVCPNCGYKDGFHSMFQRIGDSTDFCWRFICPSCHKIYDIGLMVHIAS